MSCRQTLDVLLGYLRVRDLEVGPRIACSRTRGSPSARRSARFVEAGAPATMPMMSDAVWRSPAGEAGRWPAGDGAMTSGLAALARETSVERSDGGSGHEMTSTISTTDSRLVRGLEARAWFWPKSVGVHDHHALARPPPP